MSAAISRQDQLLSHLFELATSTSPLPCVCLRATHSHAIKAFELSAPILALPLRGYKRALDTDGWISIKPGEIFLASGPRSVDIEHIPDSQSGEYIALSIALDKTVLDAARSLIAEPPRYARGQIASIPIAELCAPLLDWCTALLQGETMMACHAMQGVVMRLYAMGYTSLLSEPPPTLAMRIRNMVAENPARAWNSSDIENALGMSGASLRRHLAAEGESLREIIADTRLAQALQLIYATRLPIKSIAQRVGYASVSSFSKRFAARYGIEPSRIGNQ
ncbi:helix-turn-helix transcriptional regulator [Uliginosibacterium sediminicola]|uniref:Helix-turn-helix transcriptional regulator n=1 Tax=Uliginosibacterium sediminicola TaxID=2024550 RepID=A0ABU9YTN0_9RHOO